MINDKENEYEKDEQNTLCHDGTFSLARRRAVIVEAEIVVSKFTSVPSISKKRTFSSAIFYSCTGL